jgi:hypothetical protein
MSCARLAAARHGAEAVGRPGLNQPVRSSRFESARLIHVTSPAAAGTYPLRSYQPEEDRK